MYKIVFLCLLLQGCTLLIHNEYYQIVDRSVTVYDATTLFTEKKSSKELLIETLTKE